jgi:hypothetical protein
MAGYSVCAGVGEIAVAAELGASTGRQALPRFHQLSRTDGGVSILAASFDVPARYFRGDESLMYIDIEL